jgi:hypothetical protein
VVVCGANADPADLTRLAAGVRPRYLNGGLLTTLLTNRSASGGTEAHVGDRSPRSRPVIRSSGVVDGMEKIRV